MNISHSYLQQIDHLVTNIIPLNICRYHSVIPISFLEDNPSFLLIAMVDPKNLIARDVLRKILKKKQLKYQKFIISQHDYERLLFLYDQYLLKQSQQKNHAQILDKLDYNNYLKFQHKSHKLNSLSPKSYDLVLGGNLINQNSVKQVNSLVLGGEEGIKYRFQSQSLAVKINALYESLKFENLAIQLLKKILTEETGIIIWIGYSLAQKIKHPEAHKLVIEYSKKREQQDLKGSNLQGLNLQGVDLEKADLSNVNFQGIIINKDTKIAPKWLLVWKIVNQGLKNENWTEIQLNKANLKESNIQDFIFRNGLLSEVNLSQANLTSIDFQDSTLNNVNLDEAYLNNIKLKKAIFQKISLQKTSLNQITFNKCDIREVNFKESQLKQVDFSHTNLSQVNFDKAILTDVNFQNATLNQVNFSQTILHNVDMSYLNLSDLKLNLSQLDLSNSKFIRANLMGVNLSGANLENVNLSGANLCSANLENANLNGTKLILATYNENTIFPTNFNPIRFGAISN